MKLSIKNEYFIQISFHSIWHSSLENNQTKLLTDCADALLLEQAQSGREKLVVPRKS
jgi:hypothetical protein